ncbi:MAG: ethanolamine utilization protein EutN [Bacteroidetes bacterium GWA2_31_9]|nr:MAG: ethanolamine utilization protein EutN [Bacteroidetes bacterium GWA2_31_9]
MILAKVVGTVVASQKSQKMEGQTLLLLEKVDPITMKGKNDFVVSVDSVGAGVGEIVFYVSGSSARYTSSTEGKPTDSTIVAIVDFIEKDGEYTYRKD